MCLIDGTKTEVEMVSICVITLSNYVKITHTQNLSLQISKRLS